MSVAEYITLRQITRTRSQSLVLPEPLAVVAISMGNLQSMERQNGYTKAVCA